MEKPRRSQSRAWKLSPAALALAVGLACWGAAALAGEPIPGVDVNLGKDPGGIVVSAPTNNDGTYLFTGLAPGKYNLSIAGQRVQTITVGANRSVSGILSRQPDGTASITFNGRTRLVVVEPAGTSAMQQVSTTRGRLEKPDQPLQPGITDKGATVRSSSPGRAPPPDATSSGDGKARTIELSVQPVNDPPSKVDTGPPFVPGGPVTVQLRNVDTGALARTMPNSANGELAFTGLQVGTYVVEIVDTVGKIVGTSPSLNVAAGGRLSGRLGQSERGAGYSFFDVFVEVSPGVPLRQNASADKSARSAVSANDAAASPVGGFGKGMPGSPGSGPNVGGMGGPAPGMMSPPGLGPGAPAMSGPMGGAGGRTGAMTGGGAMGRP